MEELLTSGTALYQGLPDNLDAAAEALKKLCRFLTWHSIHIHEQNSRDYVNYVFNHPYVVTLGRLADVKRQIFRET